MIFKEKSKKKFSLILIASIISAFALNLSFITYAYISKQIAQKTSNNLHVNILFGVLDDSQNPTGKWGTESNPYLISETRHLQNLVVVQNRPNQTIIDKDSVFQVSDPFGNPIFLGGPSATNLLPLTSIGTENFPFISTFRGVTTSNSNAYVTLPTGEKSDTSVLGNIQINATEFQTDIGLFGNVGPTIEPEDDEPVGSISDLLIYNVNISSSSKGGTRAGHRNFVTRAPYESNHIGILAGHAQYTSIKNISVYYSTINSNPTVKAFNIHSVAGQSSVPKYTTASGIIGYYNDLYLGDEDLPVTSDGSLQDQGDGNPGLGLGVVYSDDIWKFMEEKTTVGNPAPNNEYSLQETFGPELYGLNNTEKKYFQIGVFTFGHSMQTTYDDTISNLWEGDDNEWEVSTNGSYNPDLVAQDVMARRYNLTPITNLQMHNPTQSQLYHQLNSELSNSNKYRYLITIDNGGKTYALIRNGTTAAPKEIDTSNFVIPSSELEYYTFSQYSLQLKDENVPPYGEYGVKLDPQTKGTTALQFSTNNRTDDIPMQYLGYGKNITRDNIVREIPRPLRIYYVGGSPSTSFMASSSANLADPNTEGVRFIPVRDDNSAILNITNSRPDKQAYSRYVLQRRFTKTSNHGSYMSYTAATGFGAVSAATGSGVAKVRLWAVDISNPQTGYNYNKEILTPTGGFKTYDMRHNVLFYTGDPTNATTRYRYEYRSLAVLDWPDNKGKQITELNHAIKMAAPTSYYYLSNRTRFWGVIEGIPNPGGTGTINVPEGSIGFTVQGGSGGGTTKIQVIVATDPLQDLNQTITVSRFGTGTNQKDNRYEIGSLPLPPVPGPSLGTTVPIRIVDNGTTYTTIYPNQNKLLIAYVFSVPIQTTAITYFLEASQGNANFVYLSSERSSAKDNNPFHENDAAMKQLDSVDFVNTTSSNVIATVSHPDYTRSLTAPYFGITRNPDNLDGDNPALDALIVSITTTYNFTYAINRAYNPTDEKYYIYISVVISAPSNATGSTDANIKTIMDNHNFNFGEWSYLNTENFEFVFSDVVVLKINTKTVDWTKL